jgi:uncharacterized protein (TIGR02996 family)
MNAESLLADVLEHPTDDDPRLVYADWLEEHGEPERAEFIRVQCELARTPRGTDRWQELHRRNWQLQFAFRQTWLRGLPAWARSSAIFERGFVADLELSARTFLAKGAQVLQRTPIQRLRLRNITGHFGELAASPLLNRLGEVELKYGQLDLAAAEALAASPLLERVTGISSRGSYRMEIPPLRALLESPRLVRLRSLCLRFYARVGDEAAGLIAASPRLAGLGYLELFRSGVSDAGAASLAESPHLGGLSELHLYGNALSAEGEALLRQRFGDRLK